MTDMFDERRRGLEEEYFHKKNQEALEKMRDKIAVAEQAKAAGTSSMSCPRCDGKLLEADYQHIKVDVCNKCHGIWFDAGELAQVIDKDKEGGWFSRLFD